MTKALVIFCLLLSLFGCASALAKSTILVGSKANSYINGSEKVRLSKKSSIPNHLIFKEDFDLSNDEALLWFKKQFKLNKSFSFKLLGTETDQLGMQHFRYRQLYDGNEIFGSMLIVHTQAGKVKSINGFNIATINENATVISFNDALNIAKEKLGASVYKWEEFIEEQHYKAIMDNPLATYFPKNEMVYAPKDGVFTEDNYRKCYHIELYASVPMSKQSFYIDASSGEILMTQNHIHEGNANGTATTAYSGTQSIITDSTGTNNYRLRENSRGNGIRTFDMNTGTSYGAAVDFTDSNNVWNNVNAQEDEYATDAHWGSQKTYDYFSVKHGRNGIDGSGYLMRAYIHYDVSVRNAFWNGNYITIGDGNATSTPLTTCDIVGHEWAHGLTDFTSDLIYQNEFGALNESFSDIFGVAIEWYAKPDSANWLIGDEIGAGYFRSMSNPNAKNDPDTYLGTHWYTGTNDNGGVHTNSGVQNFWFYLLTVGGTGTNDNSDNYSVSALGMDTAAAIAFRNNTIYLFPTAEYDDARYYAIQSAIDLYGPCSFEVEQTTNAWHAVGVGDTFVNVVTAGFVADFPENCSAPSTINFTAQGSNAGSYKWYFGDGDSSLLANPTHTFDTLGNYDITLIAYGGSCGNDTLTISNYIKLDPTDTCIAIIGTHNPTECFGVMYDENGPNNNYGDLTNLTSTIAPVNAQTITLNFSSFHYEVGYDYLYVYDGPNTSSPLIGQYDGTALPNGGTITSTGGSITLRQSTDTYVNESGFELDWSCTLPPLLSICDVPEQAFCVSDSIVFTDNSIGSPISYLWNFGDGNTSNAQNPNYAYSMPGSYTVTLVVSDSTLSDTSYCSAFIVANPNVNTEADKTICEGDNVNLRALPFDASYQYNWSNGMSGYSINVSPTVTTDYIATVTNSNGCVGTDTVRVNVLAKPIAELGSDFINCLSNTVVVGNSVDTSTYSYSWNTGNTTSQISLTPAKDTLLIITVTDNNGCSDKDSIFIQSINCPGVCYDTIILNNFNLPDSIYQAEFTIISNAIADSGKVVELKAASGIDLNPGFEIKQGADVYIGIDSCQ